MHVLGGDVLWSRDPAFIKAILTSTEPTSHALIYEKGPWLANVLGDFLGQGIFNSDGDVWKSEPSAAQIRVRTIAADSRRCPFAAHRAMTRPFFAKERISHFETFAKHSDHLIAVIRELSSAAGSSLSHSKGAVEVQDLLGRFTLDAAVEFLLGGSLVSLSIDGVVEHVADHPRRRAVIPR